jgi:hypothetical protein
MKISKKVICDKVMITDEDFYLKYECESISSGVWYVILHSKIGWKKSNIYGFWFNIIMLVADWWKV